MPDQIKRTLHSEWVLATTLLNGLAILSISLVSVLGYILKIARLYQWWQAPVGMAPNTALALFICGLTFILLSIYLKDEALRCSDLNPSTS